MQTFADAELLSGDRAVDEDEYQFSPLEVARINDVGISRMLWDDAVLNDDHDASKSHEESIGNQRELSRFVVDANMNGFVREEELTGNIDAVAVELERLSSILAKLPKDLVKRGAKALSRNGNRAREVAEVCGRIFKACCRSPALLNAALEWHQQGPGLGAIDLLLTTLRAYAVCSPDADRTFPFKIAAANSAAVALSVLVAQGSSGAGSGNEVSGKRETADGQEHTNIRSELGVNRLIDTVVSGSGVEACCSLLRSSLLEPTLQPPGTPGGPATGSGPSAAALQALPIGALQLLSALLDVGGRAGRRGGHAVARVAERGNEKQGYDNQERRQGEAGFGASGNLSEQNGKKCRRRSLTRPTPPASSAFSSAAAAGVVAAARAVSIPTPVASPATPPPASTGAPSSVIGGGLLALLSQILQLYDVTRHLSAGTSAGASMATTMMMGRATIGRSGGVQLQRVSNKGTATLFNSPPVVEGARNRTMERIEELRRSTTICSAQSLPSSASPLPPSSDSTPSSLRHLPPSPLSPNKQHAKPTALEPPTMVTPGVHWKAAEEGEEEANDDGYGGGNGTIGGGGERGVDGNDPKTTPLKPINTTITTPKEVLSPEISAFVAAAKVAEQRLKVVQKAGRFKQSSSGGGRRRGPVTSDDAAAAAATAIVEQAKVAASVPALGHRMRVVMSAAKKFAALREKGKGAIGHDEEDDDPVVARSREALERVDRGGFRSKQTEGGEEGGECKHNKNNTNRTETALKVLASASAVKKGGRPNKPNASAPTSSFAPPTKPTVKRPTTKPAAIKVTRFVAASFNAAAAASLQKVNDGQRTKGEEVVAADWFSPSPLLLSPSPSPTAPPATATPTTWEDPHPSIPQPRRTLKHFDVSVIKQVVQLMFALLPLADLHLGQTGAGAVQLLMGRDTKDERGQRSEFAVLRPLADLLRFGLTSDDNQGGKRGKRGGRGGHGRGGSGGGRKKRQRERRQPKQQWCPPLPSSSFEEEEEEEEEEEGDEDEMRVRGVYSGEVFKNGTAHGGGFDSGVSGVNGDDSESDACQLRRQACGVLLHLASHSVAAAERLKKSSCALRDLTDTLVEFPNDSMLVEHAQAALETLNTGSARRRTGGAAHRLARDLEQTALLKTRQSSALSTVAGGAIPLSSSSSSEPHCAAAASAPPSANSTPGGGCGFAALAAEQKSISSECSFGAAMMMPTTTTTTTKPITSGNRRSASDGDNGIGGVGDHLGSYQRRLLSEVGEGKALAHGISEPQKAAANAGVRLGGAQGGPSLAAEGKQWVDCRTQKQIWSARAAESVQAQRQHRERLSEQWEERLNRQRKREEQRTQTPQPRPSSAPSSRVDQRSRQHEQQQPASLDNSNNKNNTDSSNTNYKINSSSNNNVGSGGGDDRGDGGLKRREGPRRNGVGLSEQRVEEDMALHRTRIAAVHTNVKDRDGMRWGGGRGSGPRPGSAPPLSRKKSRRPAQSATTAGPSKSGSSDNRDLEKLRRKAEKNRAQKTGPFISSSKAQPLTTRVAQVRNKKSLPVSAKSQQPVQVSVSDADKNRVAAGKGSAGLLLSSIPIKALQAFEADLLMLEVLSKDQKSTLLNSISAEVRKNTERRDQSSDQTLKMPPKLPQKQIVAKPVVKPLAKPVVKKPVVVPVVHNNSALPILGAFEGVDVLALKAFQRDLLRLEDLSKDERAKLLVRMADALKDQRSGQPHVCHREVAEFGVLAVEQPKSATHPNESFFLKSIPRLTLEKFKQDLLQLHDLSRERKTDLLRCMSDEVKRGVGVAAAVATATAAPAAVGKRLSSTELSPPQTIQPTSVTATNTVAPRSPSPLLLDIPCSTLQKFERDLLRVNDLSRDQKTALLECMSDEAKRAATRPASITGSSEKIAAENRQNETPLSNPSPPSISTQACAPVPTVRSGLEGISEDVLKSFQRDLLRLEDLSIEQHKTLLSTMSAAAQKQLLDQCQENQELGQHMHQQPQEKARQQQDAALHVEQTPEKSSTCTSSDLEAVQEFGSFQRVDSIAPASHGSSFLDLVPVRVLDRVKRDLLRVHDLSHDQKTALLECMRDETKKVTVRPASDASLTEEFPTGTENCETEASLQKPCAPIASASLSESIQGKTFGSQARPHGSSFLDFVPGTVLDRIKRDLLRVHDLSHDQKSALLEVMCGEIRRVSL